MHEIDWEKVFKEVISVWIKPEIKRRQEAGLLPRDFILRRAQVVFYPPPPNKSEVRLNEEVQALMKVKPKEGVSVKRGDTIVFKDIEDVLSIRLPEKEADVAHITMILTPKGWCMTFDARYNKSKVQRHLEAAQEFIEAAKLASQKKHLRAFVDNAFSAAELLAKGDLMLLPLYKKYTGRHKTIQLGYTWWAELGNVPIHFKTTLDKLSGLRDSARYLKENFAVGSELTKEFLQTLDEMKKRLEDRLAAL